MVRIPDQTFEAGKYEVTFAEWDACVAAGGCNGYNPDDEGWGRANRPVINVSWDDAQAYAEWLSQRTGQSYRLLTSEEWEIVARAETTTAYSWGDEPPVCDQTARNGANFRDCTDRRTQPVGSFQPNGFGLYDIHGNVWEWVQDIAGSRRVLRGGSWYNYPQVLRSANRFWYLPSDSNLTLGFRLARDLAGAGETGSGAGAVAEPFDCSVYHRRNAPLVFHAMDPNIPPSLPTQRIVISAGMTVPISVGHYRPGSAIQSVPLGCMDWLVSPSSAARISQDGAAIEISSEAQPGSEILLTGTLRGSQRGAGSETVRILVVDEVARQLIGTWSFDEVRGCDGVQIDPPVEIRFEADNGLSATWTPFERYWDYWGRYAWSPQSGAFSLTVTGGNQIPSDVSANGQLALEGERRLALSGFHFGTRDPGAYGAPASPVSAAQAGCTLMFRRQGAGLQ
jgi:hypothetical protein